MAVIFDNNCLHSAYILVGNFDDLAGLGYIKCPSEAITNCLKCSACLDGEKVNRPQCMHLFFKNINVKKTRPTLPFLAVRSSLPSYPACNRRQAAAQL